MDRARTRLACRVFGVVQGVGFRPFVAGCAKKYKISGHVKNCGGYVELLAEGRAAQLRLFTHDLSAFPGVLRIEEIPAGKEALSGFSIVPSSAGDALPPMLPPELPVCEACLRELRDPENRRYRHPFISCAACGARYSVVTDIPYDRERTSMAAFPLCAVCEKEYAALSDRRHFAQTICCHDCGPRLHFGALTDQAALSAAIAALRRGEVIAIKGVGGYHLAALPTDEGAIRWLRDYKARPDKPLAVMFRDVAAVREQCELSREEEALLCSNARPIVLLRRKNCAFSPLIWRESAYLGAFLPYTGYQHLLLDALDALVLTSANRSGEPMLFEDAKMRAVSGVPILWHEREIQTPLDDSVVAVCQDEPLVYRRARGYVPLPVQAKTGAPAFAAGGDLKASFGYSKNGNLYLSQYLGDLAVCGNMERWERERVRMARIFDLRPQYAVCDLHPGYLSAQRCAELAIPTFRVQHHFAHTLSVMAEHGCESAIGVSFDGTGYGTDGTVWGGEFLLCNRHEFRRFGHLARFLLLGGDDAARDARKSALGALYACGETENVLHDARHPVMLAALREKINTVETSSAGRLFDAVSALLGLCMENRFEGACGEAVERAAMQARGAALPMPLREKNDGFDIAIDALLAALLKPGDAAEKAFGFHAGLALAVRDGAAWIRARTGENTVALSGGVFQNRLLLTLTTEALRDAGFRVLRNRTVSPGDGGLALGQLYWTKEETPCVSR